MKKALALLAVLAVFTLAAKPPGAVLSIVSDDGTSVVVGVDLHGSTKKDAGHVWVMGVCYDEAGVPVSREDHPLENDVAGPFTRTTDLCAAWAYIYAEGIISDALIY